MKQFLQKIVLYGLCFLLVEIVMAFMVSDPMSESSHEANVRLASERIAQIEEPKIVIIGGSGCQFGFMSELLVEHFDRPVVNTGTHACIGLQLQINLFRDYLKQGDIVLLIPEYDQFCVEELFMGYADETMLRIMVSNYPKGLSKLSFRQWIHVLPILPKYLSKVSTHNPIPTYSPYSITAINEYGDATNWDCRPAVFHENPRVDVLVMSPSLMILDYVHDFMCECEQKNIRCLLFPPAIARVVGEANTEYINNLQDAMYQQDMCFCASPDRYFISDSICFDTYYHLIQEGALLRTQMIIHDMDSVLNNK